MNIYIYEATKCTCTFCLHTGFHFIPFHTILKTLKARLYRNVYILEIYFLQRLSQNNSKCSKKVKKFWMLFQWGGWRLTMYYLVHIKISLRIKVIYSFDLAEIQYFCPMEQITPVLTVYWFLGDINQFCIQQSIITLPIHNLVH